MWDAADEWLHWFRAFLVGLPRPVKRLIMISVDIVFICGAAALAMLAVARDIDSLAHLPTDFMLGLALMTPLVFGRLGLYRAVVRFLRSRVIGTVVLGVTVLALLMALHALLVPEAGTSLAAAVVFWAFAMIHTAGSRFTMRDFLHGSRKPRERAIIYGAGNSGARLASMLVSGGHCLPVAFVDDNPALRGSVVSGLRVYLRDELMRVVEMHDASRVLLAMPSASRSRRAEIIQELEPAPLHVQTVPDMNDLVSGRANFDDLREVDVEDLLGRDPIPPRPDLISACVAGPRRDGHRRRRLDRLRTVPADPRAGRDAAGAGGSRRAGAVRHRPGAAVHGRASRADRRNHPGARLSDRRRLHPAGDQVLRGAHHLPRGRVQARAAGRVQHGRRHPQQRDRHLPPRRWPRRRPGSRPSCWCPPTRP
jgi:hypothetical protein